MEIAPPRSRTMRPSLTPLIDIVFLLLIFFLLTSALASDRFKVELPKSQSQGDPEENSIIVLIGPNDDLLVDNQPIARERLAAGLLERIGPNPAEAKLLIKADALADADDVLDVIEAAKEIGARRVTIATSPR